MLLPASWHVKVEFLGVIIDNFVMAKLKWWTSISSSRIWLKLGLKINLWEGRCRMFESGFSKNVRSWVFSVLWVSLIWWGRGCCITSSPHEVWNWQPWLQALFKSAWNAIWAKKRGYPIGWGLAEVASDSFIAQPLIERLYRIFSLSKRYSISNWGGGREGGKKIKRRVLSLHLNQPPPPSPALHLMLHSQTPSQRLD